LKYMSSDFERMFRRACGGYRLHPKMVPHMWQPGQSGNPSGSNGAVRRAHKAAEQAAEQRNNPSPGALRMRRFRQRRKHGDISVELQLYQAGTERLIELGWLRAIDRANRKAVTEAFLKFAGRAFNLGVEPTSRVP
jgi:hypothetical protein